MKLPANGVAAIYLLLHCVSGSVLSECFFLTYSIGISSETNLYFDSILPLAPCFSAESSALQSSSPFMSLPRNFWQEISVPYTDLPSDDDEQEDESAESTTHDPYPFFDDANMTANVTTQLGADVYLHCRVNDLRERTVSWVRRKGDEIHLITVGRQTYSSDSRYSLQYQPPNDWQLLIQYSNERDEGHYECQISSYPPLVYLVYLLVVGKCFAHAYTHLHTE